jgi:predicted DCC family thiol-disulfide oxidoreductase YuxK
MDQQHINLDRERLILFDGVCNLCNGAVQFVLRHDKNKLFSFAALQSETGKTLLLKYSLPKNDLSSFLLIENNKLYARSTAAIRVAKKLNGLWPVLYICIIIPPFIRDGVYNFIARNRYKWFGKKEECMIPTPELKARFLN